LPQGVPLFYKDAYKIALSFNMKLREFVAKYCELEVHEITTNGNNLHIPGLYLKNIGQTCIFYKANGCSINSVKPYYCQSAPFISLLFQSDTAIKFLKGNCKGFGRGPYYSKKKIKALLEKEVSLEVKDWELYKKGLFNALPLGK
jgi:Fe-S-cluster containining protein